MPDDTPFDVNGLVKYSWAAGRETFAYRPTALHQPLLLECAQSSAVVRAGIFIGNARVSYTPMTGLGGELRGS